MGERLELAKGANTEVPSPVARVRITSSLPVHAVDLFALELRSDQRVRDDGDLVFYNQRRSADGCLWLVDDRSVRIALDELADDVEAVAVAAGLDDAWPGSFADDAGLRVRIEEAGESAWDGPGADGIAWGTSHRVAVEGAERCVVLIELYRRGGRWKVRAVSQGWEAGTVSLLTEYGVHVEEAPASVRSEDASSAPRRDEARPLVRPAPPQVRARATVPLAPTLPELPLGLAGSQPEQISPTRPYPASRWGDGAGTDPSEAPTEIVASPTGAWPAWPRRPAAAGAAAGAAEASRRLHVRQVARAARRAPLNLLAMDPYDFERLVAKLMTAMGYSTQRTGRSGDGGVDVEVRSDDPLASGLIVISVKRLKRTVGAHYVRELAGTVHDRDAIKGILVTTSGFGPSSYEFAAKNRLELIDGERLRSWLADYLHLDAI